MPRVTFVAKARKAIPDYGIKVGDSYYWWKFRYGGRHVSKTRPRQSQLTQSDYLSQAYSLQEQLEDLEIDPEDLSSVTSELSSIADELRNLGSEQADKRSNMPDQLQDSDTGQRLEGREQACEEIAGELENLDIENKLDDAKAVLVNEVNEKLAELVKRARKHKQQWAVEAEKLEVQTDGDGEDDPVKASLATIRAAVIRWSFHDKNRRSDLKEDQEFLVELCKWMETAYDEMVDTVREDVRSEIDGVSWEVDPC